MTHFKFRKSILALMVAGVMLAPTSVYASDAASADQSVEKMENVLFPTQEEKTQDATAGESTLEATEETSEEAIDGAEGETLEGSTEAIATDDASEADSSEEESGVPFSTFESVEQAMNGLVQVNTVFEDDKGNKHIMDIEKANVYKKYSEKVGEIFVGEVYQTWSKEVLILDEDGNELHIPKAEQIPGEHFKKSESVRAIIKSVEMRNNTTPYITLSRTSDEFLERLFEQEVPEIADGLITVKKVVRVPGDRAKVAVESYDDRVDPIGACIGVKGSRILGIVRELRNENIDVIPWSSNPTLLIQRALSPGMVSNIDMGKSPEDKVKVYMLPDEVKKGIGRGGVNVLLAGKLIGREIEVWRELSKAEAEDGEEDVLLDEFDNEIDGWVIDKLKSIGCDTAKSVLAIDPEDIAKRADLDDETVEDVLRILKAEFED